MSENRQKTLKTGGFLAIFFVFEATLCGNPAVKCQKLVFFCDFFGRVHPSQGKQGSSVKNWWFFVFLGVPKLF